MPVFNEHEALVTRELSEAQRDDLSSMLRVILRTVEQLDGE